MSMASPILLANKIKYINKYANNLACNFSYHSYLQPAHLAHCKDLTEETATAIPDSNC